MRIGMFADMFLPHVSGVTNHIRLYRAELERQGHEVLVFTWGDRHYEHDDARSFARPPCPAATRDGTGRWVCRETLARR